MRQSLIDLINKTIILKYSLPEKGTGVLRSIFSTEDDMCYSATDDNSIAEIIYNSIIEYSFNEFDITEKDYNNLHTIALKTMLRYNEYGTPTSKISYGFHGETILYCILHIILKAKPLISRGFFYNPLESSETKGYDSYHLVEKNGVTELWFGEVKFRNTHISGINSAILSIEKSISDNYLSQNFLAISKHKDKFNIKGSIIDTIIQQWENTPQINIIEEIKKHDIKLVYPIVILYDLHSTGYDPSIKMAIDYLKDRHTEKKFNISIEYSIYFIWLPVDKVNTIKTNVIEWIESHKQLMS